MGNKKTHTEGPWEIVPLSGIGGPYAIRMDFDGEKKYYGIKSIAREGDAKAVANLPALIKACNHVCARYADWYKNGESVYAETEYFDSVNIIKQALAGRYQ